jgi:hypothetical protein
MNPLFFLPYFTLHTLGQYTLWNHYVPFFRSFDSYTKNSWAGRATSLMIQAIVLPTSAFFGAETFCLNALGMYILNDMFHCALYEPDIMTWIHHVATFGGYLYTFWATPHIVHLMMVGTLILESTAPFVQLCWFANKAGLAKKAWFPYLAGWTLVYYLLARCLYFPYFVFWYTPSMVWPLGALFTVLNWIWFYKLVGYALALLRKAGAARLE